MTWYYFMSILFLVFGGVWVLFVFSLERALLPPMQLDVKCNIAGFQKGKVILEVLPIVKNLGRTTLRVHRIAVDLLYVDKDSELKCSNIIETDEDKKKDKTNLIGRIYFNKSLKDELKLEDEDLDNLHKLEEKKIRKSVIESQSDLENYMDKLRHKLPWRKCKVDKMKPEDYHGFAILPYVTFVRPGVEQIYSYPTALSSSASYVLVRVWCDYEWRQGWLTSFALCVARTIGFIQWDLKRLPHPHTTERIFKVEEDGGTEEKRLVSR